MIAQLFIRLRMHDVTRIPFRCKHGKDHWSVIKKKQTPKDKALEHFDDFYKTVYGNAWPDIRVALLAKQSKYMALVNNFSDTERITMDLENTGAINLRALYYVRIENIRDRKQRSTRKRSLDKIYKLDQQMEAMLASKQLSEVQSIYPADHEFATKSLSTTEEDEKDSKTDKVKRPVELSSMESSMAEAELDKHRIIDPSVGLSAAALYEYIPATKLKGMEDWVLESEHYGYYNKGLDFNVKIEAENELNFPEHLSIYTYEQDNDSRFPSPKKGTAGVLDYYLLDGGSILPVLALDLQPGDNVLDMCAAPGGKSLAALQTLMPGTLVANDVQQSRAKRINGVIDQYFAGMGQWDGRLFVTQNDARVIDDKDMFNKILVDVPCTTDRHALHQDDNNIFKPARLKERLRLPEIQGDILANALKIVRPGGTVVYSTCSLSPIQNDGVVQMALKKAWEESNSTMIVKDMKEALRPLKCIYKFGTRGLKYGSIVLPSLQSNFGPMYFCKLVRIQ